MNPLAPHHLPPFITAPGGSDWLMTVMAIFLIVAVVSVGLICLRLHALPEHMAHRTNAGVRDDQAPGTITDHPARPYR